MGQKEEENSEEESRRQEQRGLAEKRHVPTDSTRGAAPVRRIECRAVAIRRSTKAWLLVFAIAAGISAILHSGAGETSCPGALASAVALTACLVLLFRGALALFRLIIRRTSLRLAFSYFLIGVVPIPLTFAMLTAGAYLLAYRVISTRLRREAAAVVEMAALQNRVPEIQVRDGIVASSDVRWLPAGQPAPWASAKDLPRPLLEGEKIWFVVPAGLRDSGRLRLVLFSDSAADYLQQVADRSDYEVRIGTGLGETTQKGFAFTIRGAKKELERTAHPHGQIAAGNSWLTRESLYGVSIERPLATFGIPSDEERIVLFVGQTSPRVLYHQLFEQGVPEIGRVFWVVLIGLGAALFFVYLIALALAFALVGSIARNVNRLTRATQEIGRGNFTFRIHSKSRDQIGDLARSFDGMAASMQDLLAETAEKKRLDGEIAAARTIQQKLLPAPEATLPGLRLVAHFEPADEIGGDYYDYMSMPDGRTALAIGDVSGHGLPTGLLVAMVKAALSTQIESGLVGSALFGRLNDLIHRSTDTRNYMTLALLAYDPVSRRADLTNAGQLAPYRISRGAVESLSQPSFPLGLFERREFPTRSYTFESGDRVVFLTDGLVEAVDASEEPFGFERFEALLKAYAASEAEELRDRLLEALARHTGAAHPEDDRTLVILTLL
jgi:serine phosphatase RsbU (regulator of sigma subunit)